MVTRKARLMGKVVDQLTEALAAEGFTPSEPLDDLGTAGPDDKKPSWIRAWFVGPDSGVPRMTSAVKATVQGNGHGGVGIAASAWLVSAAVEDVLRDMPAEALAKGGWGRNYLESVDFGYFENPLDPGVIDVGGEVGIEGAVREFIRLLRGPVAEWFSQFNSPGNLLAAARTSSTQARLDRENPDPVLLRATVALSVVNDQVEDAAALMDWYLRRNAFHKWDSADRAQAFDAAMIERFPVYADARER
ncbi:hypothetical protein IU449_18495 [Nocardia higoensis]|uniref:Uncharacterized protein n=1 Tax=Nocardia higoensis TaxID=228599 RepID=A0ABS0DDK8_9NOCA|nr:hypothetical protein [Nocardia higoensis]MBF6356509.1 hypothetical protein [Nocardia higoensis]